MEVMKPLTAQRECSKKGERNKMQFSIHWEKLHTQVCLRENNVTPLLPTLIKPK